MERAEKTTHELDRGNISWRLIDVISGPHNKRTALKTTIAKRFRDFVRRQPIRFHLFVDCP